VTTNGTLLAKAGKALIDSGVYKVNVSVHSFEDGEDEQYHRYISDILNFADESSAAGVLTVLRLWNRGHDGGRNDRTLDLVREKFSDGEWREGSRGFRIRHKLHLEWGDRFEWPDSNAEIKGSKFFCYGLKDQFGILSDGTVVPCCLDSDGVIDLGNIFNEDIEAILGSQRAKAMVEGFKCGKASEDLCKRCGYAQRFV
jgi:radical SAM protein with 4Fe4S-binding SPASM domain